MLLTFKLIIFYGNSLKNYTAFLYQVVFLLLTTPSVISSLLHLNPQYPTVLVHVNRLILFYLG